MALEDLLAVKFREVDDLHRQFGAQSAIATYLQFFNEEIVTYHGSTIIERRGIGSSFVIGDSVYGKLGTQTPQPYLGDSRPAFTTILTRTIGSPFLNRGRIQVRDFLIGSNAALAPTKIVVGSGNFAWHGSLTALSGQFISATSTGYSEGNKIGSFITDIIPSQNLSKMLTSGMAFPGHTGSFVSVQGATGSLSLLGAVGWKDFTIECWMKTTTTASTKVILAKYGDGGAYPFLLHLNDVGGGAGSPAFQSSRFSRITSIKAINDGEWHHVAGVVDESGTGKAHLYIDGVEQGTATTISALNGSNAFPVSIGARSESGGIFQAVSGDYDEVRVSYGARYTSNFTPTTLRFDNDGSTILLWHLDQNFGASSGSVQDSSLNDYWGQISGVGTFIDGTIDNYKIQEIALSGGGLFLYDNFPQQNLGAAGSEIRFTVVFQVGS